MTIAKNKPAQDVTQFLDGQKHPLRAEIEELRQIILSATGKLTENIKWNGPNYCHNSEDRITMKIQPPKMIQLIFHRGAKKMTQPASRLIEDTSGLLLWKENDRAIATFKTMAELRKTAPALSQVVKDWITATSS